MSISENSLTVLTHNIKGLTVVPRKLLDHKYFCDHGGSCDGLPQKEVLGHPKLTGLLLGWVDIAEGFAVTCRLVNH